MLLVQKESRKESEELKLQHDTIQHIQALKFKEQQQIIFFIVFICLGFQVFLPLHIVVTILLKDF